MLRNKFYIILYRGKDFLPRRVADLVKERELELKSCQFHEEIARVRAIEAFSSIAEPPQDTSTSGTFTEFKKIQTKLGGREKVNGDLNIQLEAEIYRLKRELKEEQRRVFIVRFDLLSFSFCICYEYVLYSLRLILWTLQLNKKIETSAKKLSKLNAAWTPAEQDADLEIMTDEERENLRKIGLKMDSCLVLGKEILLINFS